MTDPFALKNLTLFGLKRLVPLHPFSYPKSHHELYRGICLLSISPVIGFLWQVFLAPWSLIHMPCCSSYWGLELGEFSEGLPRSWQEAAEEESNTWEALTRPCYAQVNVTILALNSSSPQDSAAQVRRTPPSPECTETEPTQMSLPRQHRLP